MTRGVKEVRNGAFHGVALDGVALDGVAFHEAAMNSLFARRGRLSNADATSQNTSTENVAKTPERGALCRRI